MDVDRDIARGPQDVALVAHVVGADGMAEAEPVTPAAQGDVVVDLDLHLQADARGADMAFEADRGLSVGG